MKKTIFNTIILCCLMLVSSQLSAQKFADLDKSPMDAASFPSNYRDSNKLIKIVYSRPQLKGRELSSLAPAGKVWRTGANESAELTLYVDMNLGGTRVPAGTYTFYTIPGESDWTAIISKDINTWGSYFYNEENDVARITVPVTTADESVEAFAIMFEESADGVTMHMGWGNTRVAVPFTK